LCRRSGPLAVCPRPKVVRGDVGDAEAHKGVGSVVEGEGVWVAGAEAAAFDGGEDERAVEREGEEAELVQVRLRFRFLCTRSG
jgi:hypothetical protein